MTTPIEHAGAGHPTKDLILQVQDLVVTFPGRRGSTTVIHEVAHHFGIDDDRLDELGWG